MTTKVKPDKNNTNNLNDSLFKLKKASSQTSYLVFTLSNIRYGINISHIKEIIEKPSLIYSSHMSPPVIGLQHYNNTYLPIMDFAGYRSNISNISDLPKINILVLSINTFRNDQIFGLLIDSLNEMQYITEKELIKNNYPFNTLLPSFFYVNTTLGKTYLLDITDIANQLDW